MIKILSFVFWKLDTFSWTDPYVLHKFITSAVLCVWLSITIAGVLTILFTTNYYYYYYYYHYHYYCYYYYYILYYTIIEKCGWNKILSVFLFSPLLLLTLLLANNTTTAAGAAGQVVKAARRFGYGLDGPSSIPCVGGVEIFIHSFVFRLVLLSTQPPVKWVLGLSLE